MIIRIIFDGRYQKHCFNMLEADEAYHVEADVEENRFSLQIFEAPFAVEKDGSNFLLRFRQEQVALTDTPVSVRLEETQFHSGDCIYIDFIGTIQLA